MVLSIRFDLILDLMCWTSKMASSARPCFASLVNDIHPFVSSIHQHKDNERGSDAHATVVVPLQEDDRERCSRGRRGGPGPGQQMIRAVVNRMKPVGDGTGDDTRVERWLNVLTSIPYGLCGVHAIKHRRSLEGKVWGLSLVGVSICAGLFHASRECIFPPRARSFCRKLDYWVISASTVSLACACHTVPSVPVLMATLAMIPFEPFKISAANILSMELEYARRAYGSKSTCCEARPCEVLKKSFHTQLAAAALGTLCFFAEDAPSEKHIPLVHAGWHCLSAYATATCNALLNHIELQPPRGYSENNLAPP